MASKESELIIHLGLPKTGTTAIQAYLYGNRDRLAELGVYYPETLLENFSLEDQWAHHLYAHKWGGWLDKRKFITSPNDAWNNLAELMKRKPGRYIVSSERFADVLPSKIGDDVIEFISTLVQPAKVRFIAYVRRQDILAESFFKQAVKVNLKNVSKEGYLADPPIFLDFEALFSKIAAVVGWENLIIRLYEREQLKEQDACIDFLDALGLDPLPNAQVSPISANQSINTLTTSILLLLSDRGRLGDAKNVRRHLRAYLELPKFDHLNKLSLFDQKTYDDIMGCYRDGNRRLQDLIKGSSHLGNLASAKALTKSPISNKEAIISIEQLVEIIELVHLATAQGIRDKYKID